VGPKIVALSALFVLAIAACGGSDHDSGAQADYRAYRTAEDSRNAAEDRLRRAFADISAAAAHEDRDAVVEAAKRGQAAVDDIDALLTAELEAADGLRGVEEVSVQAAKLAAGLEQTRKSLDLVAQELAIALDDPLLATRGKEVNALVTRATDLAVKGELAIRRADRAIALALGLEPRLDQMFTGTSTG
jgi:hypothetical protein